MARTLYQKFRDIWKDKPDKTTPVTAKALDHIEDGILKNSENMALKEIYDDMAISMGRKPDTAVGNYSFAFGAYIEASGNYSHAEGAGTTASAEYSHAEGTSTKATNQAAHAEGAGTESSGNFAHSEGSGTKATGSSSHAEGGGTQANGNYSHAEGGGTIASKDYQHVQGLNNIEDTMGIYAHIVGNGKTPENKSNAHTLDWDGNAWFAGDVENGNGVTMNGLLSRIEFLEQQLQKEE